MLVEPTDNGPLKFAISSSAACAQFELRLIENDVAPDYAIQARDAHDTIIDYRSRSMRLREFFEDEPPTFWFADGSCLSGIEYVALRKQPEPFPRARIEAWDWTGTHIRAESQGMARNPESIQYRVVAEMKKQGMLCRLRR